MTIFRTSGTSSSSIVVTVSTWRLGKSRSELTAEPLYGCHDSQIIQDGRPQPGVYVPHLYYRVLQNRHAPPMRRKASSGSCIRLFLMTFSMLNFMAARVWPKLSWRPLYSNPSPFLFLDGKQAGGQALELSPRLFELPAGLLQCFLGPLAGRNIDESHQPSPDLASSRSSEGPARCEHKRVPPNPLIVLARLEPCHAEFCSVHSEILNISAGPGSK